MAALGGTECLRCRGNMATSTLASSSCPWSTKSSTGLRGTTDIRNGRTASWTFRGRLTTVDMATVMQLSSATIEREWSLARAWLYDAINTGGLGTAS